MAQHSGGLELTWTNKSKALLSTGDGNYDYTFAERSDYRVSEVRLLHEVEKVEAAQSGNRPEGLSPPTTDNLLITGDAMHVLDALTKVPEYARQYVAKVKLVYIDPPFNTGQVFDNYEDNIEHSIWLTLLRDRLRQIKPLLADGGSVWVHLDDAEVHRCRVVMDEELGAENFIAEVVWEKADSPNNSARYLSKDQDVILVYAKAKSAWRPNRLPRSAAFDAIYANPDDDPRGRWYPGDPFANKKYSLGLYEITGPTGRVFRPPKGRFWRISEQKFRAFESDNRIYWGPDGTARPSLKRFLREVEGLTPRTLWRHADVGSNRTSKNEIRALFPDEASFATPKPERLMQRVLQIATDPGDIVLDCFAGSGTSAAVAHKMGRRWVTSELSSSTVATFTKPRLEKVVRGADPVGITTVIERVPLDDVGLPEGMTPAHAQAFQTALGQVLDQDESHITVGLDKELAKLVRAAAKAGDSPLDAAETNAMLFLLSKVSASGVAELDLTKQVQSQLNKVTKTRDQKTTLWHGGGGFKHLVVGPSMFAEAAGLILLAEWATRGDLARAMCAQLGVQYRPDGIFAGKRGKVRYVILDGLVGEGTISAIVDQLPERQIVEVWATQVDPDAAEALRKARKGSRLTRIPEAVLDSYRRQAAKESPFKRRSEAQDGT